MYRQLLVFSLMRFTSCLVAVHFEPEREPGEAPVVELVSPLREFPTETCCAFFVHSVYAEDRTEHSNPIY